MAELDESPPPPKPLERSGFLKDAPPLVLRLASDWEWIKTLYISTTTGTQFSDSVKYSTRQVAGTIAQARQAYADGEAKVTQLTQPPPLLEQHKPSLLEFRRKYKAFIVAGISAVAVLPALRAGPGRRDKARVAMRNLFLGGGSAAVLLYPELVLNGGALASDKLSSAQWLHLRKDK